MFQFRKFIKNDIHSMKNYLQCRKQDVRHNNLSSNITHQITFDSEKKFLLKNCKISLCLIGSNIIFYSLYKANIMNFQKMKQNYTLSLETYKSRNYHTLLTYGLVNTDIKQLMCNLLGIGTYGFALEHFLGSANFLKLYFGGIIFGGLFYLHRQKKQQSQNEFIGSNYGVAALVGGSNLPLLNFALLHMRKDRIKYQSKKLLKFSGLAIPLILLNYIILFGDNNQNVDHRTQIASGVFGALYTSYLFAWIVAKVPVE